MRERRKIGGPPKKQPQPGERVALSIRLTPDLKRRLDEAAERGGRSQSQEAEFRLELSFHREQLLIESMTLLLGKELAGVLYMLGIVMSHVGDMAANRNAFRDETWLTQPYPYDQAMRAAVVLLEALRPEGDPEASIDGSAAGRWGAMMAEDLKDSTRRFGELVAKMMVHALLEHPFKGDAFKPDAETIRELLGPILQQIREPSTDERQHSTPRKE